MHAAGRFTTLPPVNFPRPLLAYTVPFALFLIGIGLVSLVPGGPFFGDSRFLVFPLQTLVCGAVLIWFWKDYDFSWGRGWLMGGLVGILALVIWISPQLFFGFPPRTKGFNPDLLANTPYYWPTVLMRFLRLAIIVPLLEEIFWRGFLMRYLINEDFTKVRFGTYRPIPFFAVAVFFMFEHTWPDDYAAAFITGVLFNLVAVKTGSLSACVLAHAVTNFGLGLYIMTTKQWGFW